jgi:hypothetical protein
VETPSAAGPRGDGGGSDFEPDFLVSPPYTETPVSVNNETFHRNWGSGVRKRMEKLNDLRFIIGLFFSIVGGLLVVLAFALHYEMAFGKAMNLFAGLAMLAFGSFMLWMKKQD